MNVFETKRRFGDSSGLYTESPIGKMYLNRTKDPVLAVKAVSEQKKLVELISKMKDESPDNWKMVTDMLNTGVDPSVPDYNLSLYYAGKNFYSPIHYAVKKNLFKTTEMLLNYKANPSALDRYSVTPAHLAADAGSLKCLKKLIEFRADVNAKTQQFRKPMRGELTQAPVVREQQLSPEEFSFYILPYEVGSTPLHLAAKKNHIECVKLLIDQGADYNAYDEKSQTPLYLAAKAGLPECVMVQLQNAVGFPILSIETKDNDTALHECLRHGEKMRGCIYELVRVGADVSLHNIYHESAVHMALKHKWDKGMIRLLILEGYNMDFDRLKQSSGWKYNHPRTKASPLAQVVYGHDGEGRLQNTSNAGNQTVGYYVRNENLAAFFIRMGASRRNLKEHLWYELNREGEGGILLNTLMDSFAFLPPISQLMGRRQDEDQSDHFFQDISSDDDDSMDDREILDPPQPLDTRADARAAYRALFSDDGSQVLDMLGSVERMAMQSSINAPATRRLRRHRLRFWRRRSRTTFNVLRFGSADQDNVDEEDRNRPRRQPDPSARLQPRPLVSNSVVPEKQQEYMRRCSEFPSLAHLSRIAIRTNMQAKVREVIKLPIPSTVKEYILLGHKLSTSPPPCPVTSGIIRQPALSDSLGGFGGSETMIIVD